MDIDISCSNITRDGTAFAAANIKLLNQYIRALIVNIQYERIPSSINLIFDSGAVNGILGIGAALYIHNLENMGYFKVKKVSGCSIGSLIALWYMYECPEEIYNYADKLFTYYKSNKNFYIYESIVRDIIYQLIKDDNLTKINHRLYINFYDTKKCKNRVVYKFKNRNHLINCILRSSHIPFITSKDHKYQGRYIDGIVPHIFTDKNANLFIKLISFMDPLNCLNAKREQNIYSRLLRGIVGLNDFFVNGKSDMCSYLNDMSYITNLHLYIRKQTVFFIIALIEWTIIIKKHIPESIRNTMIYNKIMLLSRLAWCSLQNKLV
jgi:hypothetical protein